MPDGTHPAPPAEPGAPAEDPRRGAGRALLVGTLVLAAFFSPAILSRDQFLYRDSGRMHWPAKRWIAGELRRGHFPEWNPYLGMGVPVAAAAVDAPQHPFNLLFLALPFEVAFKLWALLSYLAAAAGGYAWARRLGRGWHASVAAGLAYALSGHLVSSSDNLTYLTSLALVPWVLAAAHAWLARGGLGRLALLGLASGLCAAGGDPQTWGFAVALLPPYAALLARREGEGLPRALGRGLAAAAAAAAAAAPFVLPVLAWMPHSSRGEPLDPAELALWNLPLPRLLELGLPHMYRDEPGSLGSWVYVAFGGGKATPIPWVMSIYVGAAVLALGAVGAARAREARWLALGSVPFAWMALGVNGGLGRILPYLPVLRGLRYWEKMAAWPSLLLAAAAAFGIDALAGGEERLRRRFAAATGAAGAALLALSAAAALRSERLAAWLQPAPDRPEKAEVLRQAARTFAGNLGAGLGEVGAVLGVLALGAWIARRGALRPHAAALLGLVAVLDLGAANVRGYTLADPIVVETRAPLGRYLESQPGLQRVFTPYEVFVPYVNPRSSWPDLREFEAMSIWRAHLLEPSHNLAYRVGNFLPYTGMVPARSMRFLRRTRASERLPHIGVFGFGWLTVPVRPDLAKEAGLSPPYQVAAVDPMIPAFLVRVPHRERAYLAGDLEPADRRQAMEFALEVDPARSGRSVVEGPVPDGYRAPGGSARIAVDLPERVAVETTSDGPALLVLNDTFAAGWTATVDGHPAEILPANYLARGVWVGAGDHRVEFAYRTPGLREGWAVAAAFALSLGAAALRRRRREVA